MCAVASYCLLLLPAYVPAATACYSLLLLAKGSGRAASLMLLLLGCCVLLLAALCCSLLTHAACCYLPLAARLQKLQLPMLLPHVELRYWSMYKIYDAIHTTRHDTTNHLKIWVEECNTLLYENAFCAP